MGQQSHETLCYNAQPCAACCCVQVRKFAYEQYAAAGLTMHPGYSPVEVIKQENGKLTCVVADKEGNKVEIKDNDQVGNCRMPDCGLFARHLTSLVHQPRQLGPAYHVRRSVCGGGCC